MDMIIESKNKSPIFIHSLFRSGSTYVFNVFRRAADYWCYQEPLHEITYFSREKPQALQADQGEEKAKLLRHPNLDQSYFLELIETWPAWKDSVQEGFVYDAYFSKNEHECGSQFWKSLIGAAKGRPLFQECRTSGRIKAIKNSLGGCHIYLWRNPWDQWWSYKVNVYFDTINQLIAHASQPPAPLREMLAALGLPCYENKDLSGALAFYGERPLTSEQSYLIFYMLWCLALKEGLDAADLLLNIDRLSESSTYQDEVQTELSRMGIDGLSFADSRVPQGIYTYKERLFFDAVEARVHLWLLEGGWRESDISAVRSLRDQYAPYAWSVPVSEQSAEQLVEQADRFKDLAKRLETSLAVQQKVLINKLEEGSMSLQRLREHILHTEQKAQKSEVRAMQSEDRALQSDARAMQSEDRALQSDARAMQSEDRARNSELRAQEAESLLRSQSQELQALYNSRSWKITAPLRRTIQLTRSIKRVPRDKAKKQIIGLARFVWARPRLKRLSMKLIELFPRLEQRLKRLAVEAGWGDSLFRARSIEAELSCEMTDSAREVYFRLKNRIGAAE